MISQNTRSRALLLLACSMLISYPVFADTASLTPEETEILAARSDRASSYIVGGLIDTFVIPFGVGQAIEGRYGDTGWIFTVSELASLGVIIAGGGFRTPARPPS